MRLAAQAILAYVLFLSLGALWRIYPTWWLYPDLSALMAAYLGLSARRKLAPSVGTALVIGYMADVLLGSPVGLLSLTSGLICTSCHFAQGRLLVRGVVFTAVFSTLVAFCSSLVVVSIRLGAGLAPLGLGGTMLQIAPAVLTTGLLGPLVFRLCRLVDSRFARTPRDRAAAARGVLL